MDKKLIETISDFLIKEVNPYYITVFGSMAKGTARKDSDIDIAFLSDEKFEPYDLFIIAQGLASIIDRDVDLIDLNEASTVFQAQIVGTGEIIFCTDEYRKAIFEMKTFKMYAKLNEEREVVFKRIMESGQIYEK
ncbi:type VII toxin-antitoxin system MntA family adenylyltransferase antitoxin [Bacillus alkalisoli]|uniref:type VII toxin-antitoxin system MntA family adenylyltransferase antitoxin n=1 Tax=Bacillus alkalisoli TaxID=2011008 RepID=UPI000C24E83B|nr:nucleotidyltransferase domain-containing protein [Bacillus alkalisoli]